jgi:RNA polymerase sigma-70 factor (ECF subfamily)
MARLQANECNGFEPLFHRYSRLTFGIAYHILHDRGEAEEVSQEVFFYLFRRAKLFNPLKGTARAWITRIASHRALDRKAYLCRRGFYLETDVAGLDNTLGKKTDLDRKVEARCDLTQIERAFNELSDVQRKTLDLYYFEALELREIADRLSQPLGNVRHHFYRGLDRLRRHKAVRQLRGSYSHERAKKQSLQ